MIPLSRIDLGPTDAAARDDDFLEKLVEPPEIYQLFDPKYWIITGEKGSGKTAVRKAIRLKHSSSYDYMVDLDFDKMDYSTLFQNLNHLAQATDLQRLHLMTAYWQYTLLVQAMRAYFEVLSHTADVDLRVVSDYLKRKGLLKAGPLRTFLNLIGECWSYIERFTDPKEKDKTLPFLPSNLSPEVVETVSKYPMFDPEFMAARKRFGEALARKGETILVMLDGFDRFENNYERSSDINVVFESLVEATYSLSIDEYTNRSVYVKGLIPHDRFLNVFLRDTDKFDAIQKSIRWNIPNLRSFLSQRIRRHHHLDRIQEFPQLWREIMPQWVKNPVYGIQENSFQYLLRHTMYRPRQLQVHLEKLASQYHGQNIDPSMVPKSVRESCRKLASYYIQEYFIDHPHLEDFIYRFKDKLNVMPYGEFRAIVESSMKRFKVTGVSVRRKVDTLYTMSFFGIFDFLKEHHEKMQDEYHYLPPVQPGGSKYRVKFYYKSPHTRISATLNDDTLVAIHPMFFDSADMKPHPQYLVG